MAQLSIADQIKKMNAQFEQSEMAKYGVSIDQSTGNFVFANNPGWQLDLANKVYISPTGERIPTQTTTYEQAGGIRVPRTTPLDPRVPTNLPNPLAMTRAGNRSLGEQATGVVKDIAPVVLAALGGSALGGMFGGVGPGLSGGASAVGAGAAPTIGVGSGVAAALPAAASGIPGLSSFGPMAPAETGMAGIQFPAMGGTAAGGGGAAGGLGSILSGAGVKIGGGLGGFLGNVGDFLGSDTFGNITDLLGAGLQGYGAYQGYQAGRDFGRTQQDVLRGLSTNLGPFGTQGLGGVGGGFDPNTGMSSFGAGELDPVRQLLNLYATGSVPGIGMGVPGGVQAAAGQGELPGYASSALAQAFGGLNVPGAEGILANLRAQAQPFEQQQLNALNENQFATGRAGTSGGALQTEAFARGLGQADTARQTTAMTLSDQLRNSAFQRFGNSANLFGGVNETGFGRELTMAGLPFQLQGLQLGNVNSALQGQSGINSQALQNFQAALAAATAASNARIGSGTNIANFAGNPNFGAGMLAGPSGLQQLGESLRGGSTASIGDILGRILRPQNS